MFDFEDEAVQRELATFPCLVWEKPYDLRNHYVRAEVGESPLRTTYRRWARVIRLNWRMLCTRWKDFRAFVVDLGVAPTPTSRLARRDRGLPYRPGNVVWKEIEDSREALVLARAQARVNEKLHRVAPDEPLMTLKALAERYGVPERRMRTRRDRGHSLRKALEIDPIAVPWNKGKRSAKLEKSKRCKRCHRRHKPRECARRYVRHFDLVREPTKERRRRARWIGDLAAQF